MGLPAPSEFKIYNLAGQTRDRLKQGDDIQVNIGWLNFSTRSAYTGGVMAVLHSRKGGDIITTLSTGQLSFKSYYDAGQWNFPPNSEIRVAALQVAKSITGATVVEENFKTIMGKFGEGGWTATGSPMSVLIKMGEEFGFNAFAVDKKVKCVDVKKQDKTIPKWEISGDGGTLIEINPVYVGPYKNQIKQAVIKSLYVPGIDPGQFVTVKSTLNPQFNKDWKVASLDANLSAYDSNWTMTLTCWNGQGNT
jgi:hypothetical protein